MPTQPEVQSWVQAMSPNTAVNNGNPNTVYNTPATVMNQSPVPVAVNPAWAHGVLPNIPMVTAGGSWMLPQIQQGAPGSGWVAPPTTPLNLPRWTLPTFPAGGTPPAGGGAAPPPGGTPPGPQSPSGAGGPAVVGGGGGVSEQPGTPPTGITVFGEGGPWNQSYSIYDPVFQSVWGSPDGTGKLTPDTLNGFIQKLQADGKWGELVDPATGKLDWRQLIDMVTEPWFQSNMYLSGLNQWDTSNVLAGLAQALTGLPVAELMGNLGAWQAGQDDERNWLEQMLVDHWADNARNMIAVEAPGLLQAAGITAQQLAGMNADEFLELLQQLAENGLDPFNVGEDDDQPIPEQGDPREGCVTLDSYIEGFGYARDVKVGDELTVIDPITFERGKAVVSYSEAKLQPVVRITTAGGLVLECSKSAPIADDVGDQIRAEDLLGYSIPIVVDGAEEFDTVLKVEDLGEQMVQHITCESKFFLAGKEKGKYLLHHNSKWDGNLSWTPAGVAQGGGWGGQGFSPGGGAQGGLMGEGGFYGTGGWFSNYW